jgi:hypothetical protein
LSRQEASATLARRGEEARFRMGEPIRNTSNLGDVPGMDPASVAARRRRLEERLRTVGVKPLTRERLRELGTGGPWESDEEFEAYLAAIYDAR